eukprot:scaffold27695_cov31-Tisochrysis_lutea.AAC.1
MAGGRLLLRGTSGVQHVRTRWRRGWGILGHPEQVVSRIEDGPYRAARLWSTTVAGALMRMVYNRQYGNQEFVLAVDTRASRGNGQNGVVGRESSLSVPSHGTV